MEYDIYKKPRYLFKASTPLERNEHIKRPFFISKFTRGYFGCSSAANTTWTLFIFGWALCQFERHEYHDRSDKERADEYLSKWSSCEKQLQMYRLARLGEDCADDVKKVIRESLGVDLDEGTIR